MGELSDDRSPVPECELIKRAQAKDEEAFAMLYKKYISEMNRYIIGLGAPLDKKDDVLQEVFLKVWTGLPNLRNVSKFKSWLYRIATHAAFDGRPKNSPDSLDEYLKEKDVPDASPSFVDGLTLAELVRLALWAVPATYRTCLLLEIEGKLSREDIADIVGIDRSSVGTYISKARDLWRKAYHRLNSSLDE